jgi:hypothetical protein
MAFSAIREVIRVQARTEIGKGEEALRRIFTECVILSRVREAFVEITVNGIDMRIYSSSLHWTEDPRIEAGRWQEEYLTKLVGETERREVRWPPPSPPASVVYVPGTPIPAPPDS